MDPFLWLQCLLAALYATTLAATPGRDIVKPRAITLSHASPSNDMYAHLNNPTMNFS